MSQYKKIKSIFYDFTLSFKIMNIINVTTKKIHTEKLQYLLSISNFDGEKVT